MVEGGLWLDAMWCLWFTSYSSSYDLGRVNKTLQCKEGTEQLRAQLIELQFFLLTLLMFTYYSFSVMESTEESKLI